MKVIDLNLKPTAFRVTVRSVPNPRWFLPLVAASTFTFLTTASRATSSDPDVLRIEQAGHSIKWNHTPPGKQERYGHAETLVNASFAKVRAQAIDYAHFKDLVPDKFRNAHVIAKTKATTDLYIQVPVLRGLIQLSTVLRFGAPRVISPGLEVIEGVFVSGNQNVKTANLIFTIHEIDPDHSVLKCDLLILPTMAAPQGAVDEELRDAAMQAIDAMQERAQGRRGTFPINVEINDSPCNP